MRVLKRGPIVDVLGFADPALAVCVCEHGQSWREGAIWGEVDGTSCKSCCEASREVEAVYVYGPCAELAPRPKVSAGPAA